MHDSLTVFGVLTILAVAAVLSAVLIIVLGPWLARYAVAEPNARSSHKLPTPQGGGIAVVGATVLASGGVLLFSGTAGASILPLVVILAAVLLIAAVGVLADKRPIAAAPRLVLQSFAVTAVLATLPSELRLLPVLPWWSERILLLIGTLWFVNLVNFMDGLDWMTVVEVVPITAALAAIGLLGYIPWQDTVISLALCGATIGFAFFNRPVAKLFLGDVGSLPIGSCLAGYCCSSPAAVAASPRYCCPYIILPTALLRFCRERLIAKQFGKRTDRISISAPLTAVFASLTSWLESLS
jgi:UDP-N-acetylmuramyl pentapeptide phosphotransferase/UDP-N-acetylglucosamine-1-phosphate transferase